MANLIRGEVPFRVGDRDMFVQYGPRELAEIQTALGFRRPDPLQPDVVEEVDEPVEKPNGRGGTTPEVDAQGLQVFRRKRVLIDANERQRRMIAAFEAAWMNPDPEAMLICFRIGLKAWERQANVRLDEDRFGAIVRSLGLAGIKLLHIQAITFGIYLKGDEDGGESEGKEERVVSASTT